MNEPNQSRLAGHRVRLTPHPELPWAAIYQGDIPFDQLPIPTDPTDADYDWAMSDPEIRARYFGRTIAVAQGKVWGVGRNDDEAIADACRQPDCPTTADLAIVFVF